MPVSITLNQQLREEYERLFNGCRVRAEHATAVERLADRVLGQRSRYQAVTAVSDASAPAAPSVQRLSALRQLQRPPGSA